MDRLALVSIICVVAFAFAGCASTSSQLGKMKRGENLWPWEWGRETSADLAKIKVGMTRDQVEGILGTPHLVSASGNTEFLGYNLENEKVGGRSEYFVKLLNGRVEMFGRKGDFGTTVLPQQRQQIELLLPDKTP